MMSISFAAVCCFAAFACVSYLRLRAAAAREYAEAAAAFFHVAETLADQDDAPAELFEMVEALNDSIDDAQAARGVLTYLGDSRRWIGAREANLRREKVLSEYFHRHVEVERPYRDMLVHWFVAVTALSPIVGRAARWAMTESAIEAAAGRRRSAKSRKRVDHLPADRDGRVHA